MTLIRLITTGLYGNSAPAWDGVNERPAEADCLEPDLILTAHNSRCEGEGSHGRYVWRIASAFGSMRLIGRPNC